MACTGPVGGLARAPLKMIATVPQTRKLLRAAMAEVVDVAASQGVSLDSNLEAALDRYAKGPVSNRSVGLLVSLRTHSLVLLLQNHTTVSTIRDICNGEVSEVLELSGAVTRIGKANGVPTPTHDFLQAVRASPFFCHEISGLACTRAILFCGFDGLTS